MQSSSTSNEAAGNSHAASCAESLLTMVKELETGAHHMLHLMPVVQRPQLWTNDYISQCLAHLYTAVGTCPNIMFAVHYLSQHSIAPGSEHLLAMKWVYQYLDGTTDLGLPYHGKLLDNDLTGFSDSDWAGDPNSWRSVSGYTFLFCGAALSWDRKSVV